MLAHAVAVRPDLLQVFRNLHPVCRQAKQIKTVQRIVAEVLQHVLVFRSRFLQLLVEHQHLFIGNEPVGRQHPAVAVLRARRREAQRLCAVLPEGVLVVQDVAHARREMKIAAVTYALLLLSGDSALLVGRALYGTVLVSRTRTHPASIILVLVVQYLHLLRLLAAQEHRIVPRREGTRHRHKGVAAVLLKHALQIRQIRRTALSWIGHRREGPHRPRQAGPAAPVLLRLDQDHPVTRPPQRARDEQRLRHLAPSDEDGALARRRRR
mmetsp:Transcript_6963/g.15894  ORF Transcript_6963/g.15894 Transcript_6963/m.15894 type:complete len:267 (+) Transcript_6963:916-1716(+)